MKRKNRPLIGRKNTAYHGEFLEPRREIYFYFGSEENQTFGAGICRIPPMSSNQMHAHDDADEIIYVIDGEMKIIVDDESFFLSKADAIILNKGQEHQIFNMSDTEELLHTFTFSPPQPADAIKRGYGKAENFRVLTA